MTLETQYKHYLDELSEYDKILDFEEWKTKLGQNVTTAEETLEYQLHSMTTALNYQMKETDKYRKATADLASFLEYEEAYTVDPTTQKRIRTKLQEIGVWPASKNG